MRIFLEKERGKKGLNFKIFSRKKNLEYKGLNIPPILGGLGG